MKNKRLKNVPTIRKVNLCRICRNKSLEIFLNLGPSPLANSFVLPSQFRDELFLPLDVVFCRRCSLVQLAHVVDAGSLYRSYIYIPSTANTMLIHFGQLAAECILFLNLSTKSFVVDIGSNDGTLLKHFHLHGIKTLGVDPARNLAKLATGGGIETVVDFFSKPVAKKILETRDKADLITATNVFAHVDDLEAFLHGVETLLADDGVFVIEFPYILDLLQKKEFDTIYHEHLSYYSVRSLLHLFSFFSLEIFDIKRLPVHGGSLRVYVQKKKSSQRQIRETINLLVNHEKMAKLDDLKTYRKFANDTERMRKTLVNLLTELKRKKKRVAGLGAPAKGNTLLNYCKIDRSMVEYIADSTPTKWGLYTPGTHIPIHNEDIIKRERPDYLLILAWNFAEEIMSKQREFKRGGGKFIIPIPQVKIY